jgi:3'-phosphoadenosine 5'-phosphosulfate sulfotransferase (PAPS reductase)/FAD synthetase
MLNPLFPAVSRTAEIDRLLALQAPVAMGISGGKDSCVLAFAVREYLDGLGHTGPRLLIHADLGRVEWKDSAPTCERLAVATGMELVTVRRKAGDMLDRWNVRWQNNVARYVNLECVKMILPWSTASMRFCTSELKTAVICRDLVERYPGQTILSAVGIRREESTNRALAPIAMSQNKLTSTKFQTTGLNWNPILDWKKTDVFAYLAHLDFALHEAYTTYQSSRVSCMFCILGSAADAAAAASCPDNHATYREQVSLEIASSFSFWDTRWLGDVAPQLLTEEMRDGLQAAKRKAVRRVAAEARIPKHLLFTKGWPTSIPSFDEARLLCDVRQEVGGILGIPVLYTDPCALIARYAELMEVESKKAPVKVAGQEITDMIEVTRGGGKQAVMAW